MASIQVDSHGIKAVSDFGAVLGQLLEHAESVKPRVSIEPPLEKSDFRDLQSHLSKALPRLENDTLQTKRIHQFAIIETAVRDVFGKIVASTPIDSPAFIRVWNLLDLLSILSDMEQCDPALLFWLVEELLDSQTIAGCRKIFDFLESRRQRITAKHFKSKQLIVLRSCNELLRRLSRAKDTAFCGRVFIFMFQSFPLGDKSSVNLRGEYHVENVTTFDQGSGPQPEESSEKMEVDGQVNGAAESEGHKQSPKPAATDGRNDGVHSDMDALYPVFWSLQASFSQPKKLFDPTHFADFKAGLSATLAAFRAAQNKQSSRSQKQADEPKTGQKRKRDNEDEDLADTFNPKYLTSPDLFKLELSDLTFRRHILVQALIIMDFLLSLSAEAKEKLSDVKAPNKSVTYSDQLLSKEDTEWATKMRRDIIDHLRVALVDGAYFLRMVDTVLARDKNWVRWKIDSCPSIELPSVTPESFAKTKDDARNVATNKILQATLPKSLSIAFLDDGDTAAALGKFKSPNRYLLPELDEFRRKIDADDVGIELASNNQEKAAALESKASKSWRALRIAGRSRLAVFDKIDDPDKIGVIFADNATETAEEVSPDAPQGKQPADVRPVVVSGPPSVGKSSLVKMLMDRNPGVFGKVPPHTTRAMQEGESNGKDFHCVERITFNMMRDGDQLLEFSTVDGNDYGVSRRVADAIRDSGKIPIMELSVDSAQQTKDMGYEARRVFIKPPDTAIFKDRLKKLEFEQEKVERILKCAMEEQERSTTEAIHEEAIVNDDLETAYSALERFIYGSDADAEMKDEAEQPQEPEPEQSTG